MFQLDHVVWLNFFKTMNFFITSLKILQRMLKARK